MSNYSSTYVKPYFNIYFKFEPSPSPSSSRPLLRDGFAAIIIIISITIIVYDYYQ